MPPVPAKDKKSDTQNQIDWQKVGDAATEALAIAGAVVLLAFGLYRFATTGDTTGIEKGFEKIPLIAG